MPTSTLPYRYAHASTESMTGYFSCEPPEDLSFEDALARLEAAPLDEFLHRHLLRRIAAMTPDEAASLRDPECPVLMALLRETGFLHTAFAALLEDADDAGLERLEAVTPLPYLGFARKSLSEAGRRERETLAAWNALFEGNLSNHQPLPHPDDVERPLPEYVRDAAVPEPGRTAADVHAELAVPGQPVWTRPPAQNTAAEALSSLATCGVIAGTEMRHESSLAPVGLLRNWNVDIAVRCGGLDYTLQGEATTWGRGVSIATARASYSMEMVERASAYLSVDGNAITDRLHPCPLIRASHADLLAQGRRALDPRSLPIDAAYREQSLYWMEGHDAAGDAVLVPVQAVGLFCNLDEPALFLSPGSTGMASGNTLDEAKVGALTEILERDAEATVPWRRDQCFTLEAHGVHPLAVLLADYARRGIHVWFRDMTTEFGVPCYQSFVTGSDGSLARGAGAGLSGPGALLSALTETPYPYPNGPASAPVPAGLAQRRLEDLPEYRLDSPARNLRLLEAVLISHGHVPVYVDLTRDDLEIPVVRAVVPGLELTADFDVFSRPSVRLFRRYLEGK
ncbi:YcaO-like family protein [uncultured Bilophila sp.]|uniref:YcaO-like family protein n=1 Tax=uncultured Bilophila sp. TaxID=529385 RepID=UPI0026DAEB9A|nr:YcaO-like family protein [uncultured Bilophila sp.]